MLKLLTLLWLVSTTPAVACETCVVTAVHDGDTMTVSCPEAGKEVLRLMLIDAPELKQPYGLDSRNKLRDLAGATVVVDSNKKDMYGRSLAMVYPEVGYASLNELMVKEGMAWSYCHKNTAYNLMESQAKQFRLGLWAGENPEAPWEYRKALKRLKRGLVQAHEQIFRVFD